MSTEPRLSFEGFQPLADDAMRLLEPTGHAIDEVIRFKTIPDITSKGSLRPYDRFSRRQDIEALLAGGNMPGLGNGFSFVIDRRPEGHEDDYIPAEQYTHYFSKRQIPIADADHRLRDHDIGHVLSYQDMFSCIELADLVQSAATKALSNPELCTEFTSAMDNLGDSIRVLSEPLGEKPFIGDVKWARRSLTRLLAIDLQHEFMECVGDPDERARLDELEQELGIKAYESIATYRESGFVHEESYRNKPPMMEYKIGKLAQMGLVEGGKDGTNFFADAMRYKDKQVS